MTTTLLKMSNLLLMIPFLNLERTILICISFIGELYFFDRSPNLTVNVSLGLLHSEKMASSMSDSRRTLIQHGKSLKRWWRREKSETSELRSMVTYFLISHYGSDHPLSSFNIRRLEELLARPLKIKPVVNQYELNYWNPEPELLKVLPVCFLFVPLPILQLFSVVEGTWNPSSSLLASRKLAESQGDPSSTRGLANYLAPR